MTRHNGIEHEGREEKRQQLSTPFVYTMKEKKERERDSRERERTSYERGKRKKTERRRKKGSPSQLNSKNIQMLFIYLCYILYYIPFNTFDIHI
jgi:hypothetical protein